MTAERTQQELAGAKRIRKRLWLLAILIALVALIGYHLITRQTLEEQLAAIEAARAIPDSENAAVGYSDLLEKVNRKDLWQGNVNAEVKNLTQNEPWRANSKDFPQLAAWIEEHRDIIETLLEASKKDKCRFPISRDTQGDIYRVDMLGALLDFLKIAADNDMADGRADAALEKYLCIVRVANHLYQQLTEYECRSALIFERRGLQEIPRFLMRADATEEQYKTVETVLGSTRDTWSEDWKKRFEVTRLIYRLSDRVNPAQRLKNIWPGGLSNYVNLHHRRYFTALARRRGIRILCSLRRHKDRMGRWPKSLDEIRDSLPEEILSDPKEGTAFIYKLTRGGFKLYGTGLNRIDEDGRYKDTGRYDPGDEDDVPIWPTPGKRPAVGTQDPDPNQPHRRTEPPQ